MLNELLAYVYAVEQNKTLFILISANLTYFIPKEMHRGTRSGLLFYFCLNLQNHSCKKKEKKLLAGQKTILNIFCFCIQHHRSHNT